MARVTIPYRGPGGKGRTLPSTFADVYAAVATDQRQKLGDALAQQAGPPQSTEVQVAGDRARVEAWNTPHPEATDEAMWQLAQQQYAEHKAAGMPDAKAEAATAEDLTHYRYRARQPLYTNGTTTWAEQVKEAERIADLSAKQEPPRPLTSSAPSSASEPSPASAPNVPSGPSPASAPNLPSGPDRVSGPYEMSGPSTTSAPGPTSAPPTA